MIVHPADVCVLSSESVESEERVFSTSDGLERLVLFAAAGCSLYAFVGANLEKHGGQLQTKVSINLLGALRLFKLGPRSTKQQFKHPPAQRLDL